MTTFVKSSKGRATTQAPSVPGVETLPCPSGGLHVLTNDAQARVSCARCGESWQALDAAARVGGVRPFTPDDRCDDCGCGLVTDAVWRPLTTEGRAAKRAEGIYQRRGHQCMPCYTNRRRVS